MSELARTVHEIEVARLRAACAKINDVVCQELGKALGYPWYKDNQEIFPGAMEADGVCVGDHVAESLAAEAARRIERLEAQVAELEGRERFYLHAIRVQGEKAATFAELGDGHE